MVTLAAVILQRRHTSYEQKNHEGFQVLSAFDDAFVLDGVVGGDDLVPVVGASLAQMVVEFRQSYWGAEYVGQDILNGVDVLVVCKVKK